MEDTNRETVMLRMWSVASGVPWAIFHDEQIRASVGVTADAADPAHDKLRKQQLWGKLMGGGPGVEWCFGYQYDHTDLKWEDWRSRYIMWDQVREDGGVGLSPPREPGKDWVALLRRVSGVR